MIPLTSQEIDAAIDRSRNDPVWGPAVRTLMHLAVWTTAQSLEHQNDARWENAPEAARVSEPLQGLIREWMDDHKVPATPSDVEAILAAYEPIQRYVEREQATVTIEKPRWPRGTR